MTSKKTLREIKKGTLEGFDLWRKHYTKLTFKQLAQIYHAWAIIYPERQDGNYCMPAVFKAIEVIKGELGKDTLNIIEFGGYEGELAYDVFTSYPNFTYVNYDFCIKAIKYPKPPLKNYEYRVILLKKPFWKTFPITHRHFKMVVRGQTRMSSLDLKNQPKSEYDLFITSHTLEHLSDEEVFKVLDHMTEIPFMYIQMPIREGGYDGVKAGHICSLSWSRISKHLTELGYNEVKMGYLERWEKRMCRKHQNYIEVIKLFKHR